MNTIKPNNTNTSFKAQLICKTTIKKRIPFTPFYKNVQASFVALNRNEDTYALGEYANAHFQNKNSLTHEILANLKKPYIRNHNTFALTLQTENFSELDGKKILGSCDGFVTGEGKKSIFYLSGIETLSHKNTTAKMEDKETKLLGMKFKYRDEYKRIGKKILQNLIILVKRNNIETIELTSLERNHPFYKDMGFDEYAKNRMRLHINNET